MNTRTLEKSQIPARFPIANKLSVRLCESMQLNNVSWSGGTRSYYLGIDMATGETSSLGGNNNPVQFGGNNEGRTIELKPGFGVLESSIFCGKDMGYTLYCLESDADFLPAQDDISRNERIVLIATRGFKNTYSGETNLRFKEAHRETGIDSDTWETTKAGLIEKRLLRKNGSITPKGQDLVGWQRLYEVTQP